MKRLLLCLLLLCMMLQPLASLGESGGLAVNIKIDDLTIRLGETVTATWTVTGGTPPYTTRCLWRVMLPGYGWVTDVVDEKQGTSSYVPTEDGSVYALIEVTDAAGNSFQQASYAVAVKAPKVQYTTRMVMEKVAQIAADCMAEASSAYARVLWLHDWLVMNATYDYSFTYYDAGGVLIAGKGVCQSFAEAYQMLLDKVGITNRLVTGKADNGQSGWQGHAWNLVNISGAWYHVDVTWDEGTLSTQYFLKSDQTMAEDHKWTTSRYPAAPNDWGQTAGLPGDANADKAVDILDLVSVIDYIVSGTECTSMANADANEDKAVDILDLVWIIDAIVGG